MPSRKPLKILLVALHPGYSRFFFNTIARLLDRGHTVHVAFNSVGKKTGGFEAWDEGRPGLTIDRTEVPARSGRWKYFLDPLQRIHNYLRYLDRDEYEGAAFLRNRIGDLLPASASSLRRLPLLPGPVARLVRRAAGGLERLAPTDPAMDAYIRKVAPDLVLVSPLIDPKDAVQADVIRSAQAMGIPTGLCVGSWDHLTSKGMMHSRPDKVFLWNEAQKLEAVRLHDVPAGDVVVTGAQPFDLWFGRRPTLSRAAFCRKLGLPPRKPYVLFAGSSNQINRPEGEIEFVKRWLEAVRTKTDARHRNVGVLIRPHPVNFQHWVAADAPYPRVVIYPRYGANPVNDEDRADYFHSIYYAAAVVGINTSAMVEATILDKPVLTILADAFGNQGETLHFRYLLPQNGGFLRVAENFDQHAAQLSQTLDRPQEAAEASAAFATAFLRPRGREAEAVDHLVSGIEALGAQPRRVRPAVPALARPLSWVLDRFLAPVTARQIEEDRQREARQRRKRQPRQRKLTKQQRSAASAGQATGGPGG